MITPGSAVWALHYKKVVYPIRLQWSRTRKAFGSWLKTLKKSQGLLLP
jgi:hypothetical protein